MTDKLKNKTAPKKRHRSGEGVTRGGIGFHKLSDRHQVPGKHHLKVVGVGSFTDVEENSQEIKWFVSANSH